MNIVINLLLNGFAVLIVSKLLPGVQVDNYLTAIIVAIVLGVVNTVLKPILVILTLPIDILTLGVFVFVINAVLVLLVSALVPGFTVSSFWWALVFSLVLSLVNSFFHSLAK